MTYPYGKSLLPATVGFDRLFSTMEELDRMVGTNKAPTYPPYNIVKFDMYNYEIQIAVAGFSKDDISVETNHNKLHVSGVSEKSDSEVEYLHHGLAKRDFKHVFTLSDTSVVRYADVVDGILKISIENVIPEEKRPRKIPIGISQNTALLTEDTADKEK
jgi:molecular chaperone IbpA